jgi:hypothetical protein
VRRGGAGQSRHAVVHSGGRGTAAAPPPSARTHGRAPGAAPLPTSSPGDLPRGPVLLYLQPRSPVAVCWPLSPASALRSTSSLRSSTLSASRCSFLAMAFQSVAATPVRQSSCERAGGRHRHMHGQAPLPHSPSPSRGGPRGVALQRTTAAPQGYTLKLGLQLQRAMWLHCRKAAVGRQLPAGRAVHTYLKLCLVGCLDVCGV